MRGGSTDDILTESFRIIEAEIGTHSFGPLEWPIVRRIIHASGDLELGRLMYFSPGAAAAGVQAFQQGVPIVTDVRMVAAGIQAPLREALGVGLHCFLDAPEVSGVCSITPPPGPLPETERGREEEKPCLTPPLRFGEGAGGRGYGTVSKRAGSGLTRCARAMEHAVAIVPEAVYVIGNAPTALSVLCAAVRRGVARPRLVIAMPVGFVGVIESKEEALALPVPVVAVRGRRGGSAVAAAAVNALLLLAREEGPP